MFSQTVKDEYVAALPNVVITDAIGSSETGFMGISMVTKDSRPGVGGPRVNAGRDTIVIDLDNRPIPAGSDEIGRLARGGYIPLGYYKDPEKSAATFPVIDGVRWSVPGDHARIEDDGTITVLGRGSVSINTGGEKVYPEEVEAALKSHPAVFDAVVVGVPDERWGERVVALVETREGATTDFASLDAHVRAQVASYKAPREVLFVKQILRSPSGKPDYRWAKVVAVDGLAARDHPR